MLIYIYLMTHYLHVYIIFYLQITNYFLVDVHIADAIINEVVKQKLIAKGKTVIMATSHYKYLKKAD
jgi:hypothetical protein